MIGYGDSRSYSSGYGGHSSGYYGGAFPPGYGGGHHGGHHSSAWGASGGPYAGGYGPDYGYGYGASRSHGYERDEGHDRRDRRDAHSGGDSYGHSRDRRSSNDTERGKGRSAGASSSGRGNEHSRSGELTLREAPRGSSSGTGPDGLLVSGCQNATVGGIVEGDFLLHSQNHGKPVYKKTRQVNGLDVMLYFWDDRDGPKFSGWWFGPKVGGEQIWAYHADRYSSVPPASGWQVPYDGPIDQTFRVLPRNDTGTSGRKEVDLRKREEEGRRWGKREDGGEDARRREEDRRRREEDARRREDEEARRRYDEDRRRHEQVRYEQEMQEMRQRSQYEEPRRRRDDDDRRGGPDIEKRRLSQQTQQKAALNIRRVIQKVRNATPDTLQALEEELEDIMKAELNDCGKQRSRIVQESQDGLDQGRRKVQMMRTTPHSEYVSQAFSHFGPPGPQMSQRELLSRVSEANSARLKNLTEDKQRKFDEARTFVDEQKRKHHEDAQKRADEFMQLKYEEDKKKEEVFAKRRAESKSAFEIRKAIQKVRIAKEDANWESLKLDLEKVIREELDNTGSIMDQLRGESANELRNVEARLAKQREAVEKKETDKQTVQELERRTAVSELALSNLEEAIAPLNDRSESSIKDVHDNFGDAEKAVQEAQAAVKSFNDLLRERGFCILDWETKQALQAVQRKANEVHGNIQLTVSQAYQAREEGVRCAIAWQRLREIQGIFFKYGGQDVLRKQDVINYAKRELRYTVKEETLDIIWGRLVGAGEPGVKIEAFHLLKAYLGTVRELERDTKRKELRLEKEQAVTNAKATLMQKCKDASKPVEDATNTVVQVEKTVNPLAAKAKVVASHRMIEIADETDKRIESAREVVAAAREYVDSLVDDMDARYKDDFKAFIKVETKHLELQLGRLDLRLVHASNKSKHFRGQLPERQKAELHRLRKAVRNIVRYNMNTREITVDVLFAQFDTDENGEIDEQEFVAFFDNADKDIDLKDLDEDFTGKDDGMRDGTEMRDCGSLESIGESQQEQVLSSDGLVASDEAIDVTESGGTEKNIGVDDTDDVDLEVVESLEFSAETLAKAFRFICEESNRSKSTLSSEDFSHFIRVFFVVVKTTAITDNKSVQDGTPIRRLEVGEVVEVLQGPVLEGSVDVKRVFGRALSDSTEGWITTSGNLGTAFLKEGGSTFKVIKETVMTDGFNFSNTSLDSTTLRETTRKMNVGETLHLIEWPRKDIASGLVRMKARLKSDGSEGWVTTVGNQGTVYVKQA